MVHHSSVDNKMSFSFISSWETKIHWTHFPGRLTNPATGGGFAPLSRQRGVVAESDRGNFPYVDVQAGMFGLRKFHEKVPCWNRWFFFVEPPDLKLRCGSLKKCLFLATKNLLFEMATRVHFQVLYYMLVFQGWFAYFGDPGFLARRKRGFWFRYWLGVEYFMLEFLI